MNFLEELLLEIKNFKVTNNDYFQILKSHEGDVSSLVQFELLHSNLEKLKRKIFLNLNYSLLAGEYISEDNLLDVISRLRLALEDFLLEFVYYPSLQKIAFEIVQITKSTLSYYTSFIKEINNKYNLNEEDYLLSLTSILNNTLKEKSFKSESKDLFLLFYYNVRVSKSDHFLSDEKQQLIDFLEYENGISNLSLSGFDDIKTLINKKIDFLRYKTIVRREKEYLEISPYLLNTEEQQLKKPVPPEFEKWKNYLENHYEINKYWENGVEKSYRSIFNDENKNLCKLQLHNKIKYFKDVKPGKGTLEEIKEFLSNQIFQVEQEKNFFNKFSDKVILHYAYNNYFSRFVSETNDLRKIQDKFNEIEGRREFLNNFFIDFKFLDRVTEILSKKIETEDSIRFLKEHEEFINGFCIKVFKQYKINYKWSLSHYNYIFQLPFQECLIEVESDKLDKIFISSAFVLPPSKTKLEEGYNYILRKFETLQFQLNTIKSLSHDIKRIESLSSGFEDQKKEIKNREIKFLELLGLFTALIAFVFGTISTFQFIKTPYQALLFIGSFATSLIAFVFLILFFTRIQRFKKENGWFLAIIIFISIFSWVGLNTIHDSDRKNFEVLDSLKKQDSIFTEEFKSLKKELKSSLIKEKN